MSAAHKPEDLAVVLAQVVAELRRIGDLIEDQTSTRRPTDLAIDSEASTATPKPEGSISPGLVSVEEAEHYLGIGRTHLYKMLGTGELASVKIGRRRLIPAEELARFVAEAGA